MVQSLLIGTKDFIYLLNATRITSTAHFVPQESFKLDTIGDVTVVTAAKVKDPIFQQGKFVANKILAYVL